MHFVKTHGKKRKDIFIYIYATTNNNDYNRFIYNR